MKKNQTKSTHIGRHPLALLKRLDSANESMSGAPSTLWTETAMRAKLRGGDSNNSSNSKSWPGYVYVPSYMLERSISSRAISVPPEWDEFSVQDLSRIVSTIAAWNIERHVYKFTDVAAKIAFNSNVQISLRPHPFAMLPGFAAYIDISNILLKKIGVFPAGFFVSINVLDTGVPELVLVLDYRGSLSVQAIKLDGLAPDDLLSRMLSEWRERLSGSGAVVSEVPAILENLHVLLSSVLMTCINQSEMRSLGTFVEDDGKTSRTVSIFEVGQHLVDGLCRQENISPNMLDGDLIIVGEWKSTAGKRIIELKCSFSPKVDLARFSAPNSSVD